MSDDDFLHSLPASKLGEYTVIQEIAEGTFGKVKSLSFPLDHHTRAADTLYPVATHTLTGHKVAMKFISKQVIHATRTRDRVQREVEYMRTLRHPHIIKLYVYFLFLLVPQLPLRLHPE